MRVTTTFAFARLMTTIWILLSFNVIATASTPSVSPSSNSASTMKPTKPTISPTLYPTAPPTILGLQNFCNAMTGLANVSSPINSENALSGLSVTLGVNLDAPPEMIQFGRNAYNKMTVTGGYMFFLHNQLARKGGFSIQYFILPNISTYQSTDMYLNEMLTKYPIDMYGGSPIEISSHRRIDFNFDYTRQLADLSIVLITRGQVSSGYTFLNIW